MFKLFSAKWPIMAQNRGVSERDLTSEQPRIGKTYIISVMSKKNRDCEPPFSGRFVF